MDKKNEKLKIDYQPIEDLETSTSNKEDKSPYKGMDALQILRMWDLEQQEARDSGHIIHESDDLQNQLPSSPLRSSENMLNEQLPFNINKELQNNYLRFLYNTSVYLSLMCLAQLALVQRCGETLVILKHIQPNAYFFIQANIFLYFWGLLCNIVAIIARKYYTSMINMGYFGTLVLLAFMLYGLWYVVPDMYQLQKIRPEFRSLFEIVVMMICIRLFMYFLVAAFLSCFCIFSIFSLVTGQYKGMTQIQNDFNPDGIKRRQKLEEGALKFNPIVHVDQCAICLEYFSIDDGKKISQLKCNKKHTFHLKCMIDWAEKNDKCPLCRNPLTQ